MNAGGTARAAALVGYVGLWCLLALWYGWLAPPAHLPVATALALLLVPLAFPLPGLLTGKRYTYAWSSMLSLLYFAHGVSEAWTVPAERAYGLLEIGLSLLWFTGAVVYVRLSRRRNAGPNRQAPA
jgi:uncharacterized membrane protein